MSLPAGTPLRADPQALTLLLIDAQPMFWDSMSGSREPVMARTAHLLKLAGSVGVPVISTFEHPVERKGWLPERLERAMPANAARFVKRTYDCCGEPEIRDALLSGPGRQVAVAGAETDVCVLQSTLSLLELGFQVFLVEDCLFTTEPHAAGAIARMRASGAVPCTYKSLYYELTRTVDRAGLYREWNVDANDHYVSPEALPPAEPAT